MRRSESRASVAGRMASGLALIAIGLVLAAPSVVEIRAAVSEGSRFGALILAGALQWFLNAAWFLTDRLGEILVLCVRAWPLLLTAGGAWILWRTLAGLRRGSLNGEAEGGAS